MDPVDGVDGWRGCQYGGPGTSAPGCRIEDPEYLWHAPAAGLIWVSCFGHLRLMAHSTPTPMTYRPVEQAWAEGRACWTVCLLLGERGVTRL